VTGSRRELEGGHDRILEGDRLDLVLEVQLKGLLEALQRAIDRVPLARHLDLEAASDEPISLMGDRGRELHAQIIGPGCDESLPAPCSPRAAGQLPEGGSLFPEPANWDARP